jgi:hypothetical protein
VFRVQARRRQFLYRDVLEPRKAQGRAHLLHTTSGYPERACWTATSSSMPGMETGRLAVARSISRLVSGCARSRTEPAGSPGSTLVSMSRRSIPMESIGSGTGPTALLRSIELRTAAADAPGHGRVATVDPDGQESGDYVVMGHRDMCIGDTTQRRAGGGIALSACMT